MSDLRSRLVASPCCLPQLELDPLLELYGAMGFENVELFTTWSAAAVDPSDDAVATRRRIEDHGFQVTSVHLPVVTAHFEATLGAAVAAAGFAQRLGAEVVLFKAETLDLYARAALPFLDATASLDVTPVLQNHRGKAISTLADLRAAAASIDDPRMKVLLEVGHLARVGDDWREGCAEFADRIALVHVNDIDTDGRSVPYGTGTIDFRAVLADLAGIGYEGDIVVELDLDGHRESIEPTATELRRAVDLLCELSA